MSSQREPGERGTSEDVFLWRLRTLEEAMRFQATELNTFRDRQQELVRSCDEIRRDYVGRGDLQNELRTHSTDRRADWTLRVMALGVAASSVFSAAGLIITLAIHH